MKKIQISGAKNQLLSVNTIILLAFSQMVFSESGSSNTSGEKLQDMSDPLAVYTQVGVGATNKGINFKVGKSYDPGIPNTMAMNIVEIMGVLGDAAGWDDDSAVRDDAVDSFRYRNFKVDMSNGRGAQVDINYALDANHLAEHSGYASYALMQALPKMGPVNIYPLAGLGLAFGNNVVEDDGTIDSGYSIYGTYALAGMYGKVAITDNLWLNYNPFWVTTMSGSEHYKDNAYGMDESSLLTHEFIVSYQFTPRFNVRAFANWNENVDFSDGDHRLEFNYQL